MGNRSKWRLRLQSFSRWSVEGQRTGVSYGCRTCVPGFGVVDLGADWAGEVRLGSERDSFFRASRQGRAGGTLDSGAIAIVRAGGLLHHYVPGSGAERQV